MSLRNGEWFFKRREKIKDLIEHFDEHPDLVKFLKDEKDRMCMKCSHWGTDVGHYDSGKMATCNHPKVFGNHHPSNGCGMVEMTLVYNSNRDQPQRIQTRWNFGCLLWERGEITND